MKFTYEEDFESISLSRAGDHFYLERQDSDEEWHLTRTMLDELGRMISHFQNMLAREEFKREAANYKIESGEVVYRPSVYHEVTSIVEEVAHNPKTAFIDPDSSLTAPYYSNGE